MSITDDVRPGARPPGGPPPDDRPSGDSPYERTPPQDIAAEQCVLGGMLLSKDAIADVIEILKGHDFYRPAHATIFDAVLDLYGRGEPADPITVAAALADSGDLARIGGAPYLHTLIASVPTAANAAYYARIVGERAVLRRLVEAGTRIVQLGYGSAAGSGRDIDDVVDLAQQAVYDITERRVSEDFAVLADMLQPTLDEIEAVGAQGGVMTGVPTGFTDLDRLLNGLHAGQLVIVAGRPGLGKSTAAMDFARSASVKHNLASAIFSLEMSKVEIVMRLLSAEARVPLHVLRSGQLSDDDWTKLARRMGEISEAPLFVDDTPNMNLMEIRAKARRLRQRHDLKLIVVDYLQLMTSPKRVESRQQEVSELSRGLKLLAKEVECPVIAVSQLNRGPEQRTDKRPQLSDLRESGCLTADTTLLRADTGAPVTFSALLRDGWRGVTVWSLDEYRRMVPAQITNVFPAGTKMTYRLRLASGRELSASANHRFLTVNGWVPLAELTIGARLAVPRQIPAPLKAGLDWSNDRIGLLAHLIGYGRVLDRQPVHYASREEANLAFVEAAARSEFGTTPRRVVQQNWHHVYLPAAHRYPDGPGDPLHDWFAELGIHNLRRHEKRIPDAIFQASQEQAAVFLRHLWAAGGRVIRQKGRTGAKVCYASTSRALADGVLALLSRFGIVARLKTVTRAACRPRHHVIVADGAGLRVFCQEIGVHGETADGLLSGLADQPSNTGLDTLPREVWELVKAERDRAGLTERQFQAAIGTGSRGSTLDQVCPSRELLARCAEALGSDALRSAATDDVFWDQVMAIDRLIEEPVFDATVEGTHNFIANGVVAHNSIEQDADVVILLHRDDYYDKESPRAGEADFIVAKHRNGPTDTVTVAAQLHLSRFVDMAIV